MTRRYAPALLIALAALALAACGAPPQPTAPPPTAAPDVTAASATPAPDSPEATTAPAETAQPAAPTPPPGWQEVTLSETGMSLYVPEGWTQQTGGPYGEITFHAPEGYGWAQIHEVDIPSGSGVPADDDLLSDSIAIQQMALGENGDFGEPQPVETRGGLSAAQLSGTYYVLGENLLVGVAVRDGRQFQFSGHGPGLGADAEATWAELEPIFETMFASLALAGG